MEALPNDQYCPHQDLTFKLFGNPGEDYFKGNPKSLNFYFLVIWWGKNIFKSLKSMMVGNDSFYRAVIRFQRTSMKTFYRFLRCFQTKSWDCFVDLGLWTADNSGIDGPSQHFCLSSKRSLVPVWWRDKEREKVALLQDKVYMYIVYIIYIHIL